MPPADYDHSNPMGPYGMMAEARMDARADAEVAGLAIGEEGEEGEAIAAMVDDIAVLTTRRQLLAAAAEARLTGHMAGDVRVTGLASLQPVGLA